MRTKMATTEAFSPPRDHSTPKHTPKIFGHENEVEHHERKSLQTLQCSALDDSSLVGVGWPHSGRGEKTSEKAKQFKPTPGPVKVYRDKKTQGEKRCVETQGTQTDDSLLEELIQKRLQQGEKRGHASLDREEEEAYELMVKDPVPATYWKEIAEQRRLALNDTLEENKSLHKEMDSLREENEKLSELASQAAYLSSLLQSVVSDDEDNENTDADDRSKRPDDRQVMPALSDDVKPDDKHDNSSRATSSRGTETETQTDKTGIQWAEGGIENDGQLWQEECDLHRNIRSGDKDNE